MRLPIRRPDESRESYVGRAYINETVKAMYPDHDRRLEVCLQNACEAGMNPVSEADFMINSIEYGWTEEITAENWIVPSEADYEEGYDEELDEVWDISEAKPGLWENIRKKKEREGKNYKPAKKGDKDRPDPESYKKAQSDDFKPHKMYDKDGKPHEAKTLEDHLRMKKMGYTHAEAVYKYEDPKTGQVYEYQRKGIYKKDGRTLVPARAAEYQGKKVKLGKPFRTPKGPKKSAVYVRNGSGKVVIVRFGDPNMSIKKDNPKRRKSFRARHNCDNPGPRWKAKYWSCRAW
jgi:hypothetical protein